MLFFSPILSTSDTSLYCIAYMVLWLWFEANAKHISKN